MNVLIADDSSLGRLMLRNAIEALGHTCRLAADGEEAWQLFEQEGADVVISDWMMPGLEGPELCRRIRAKPAGPYSYTYFILLTMVEDRQLALQGMDAGADDYLAKPLDIHELQMRLIAAQRLTNLYRELAVRDAQLRYLAETDQLTELANRRKASDVLGHFLHLARRQQQPLGLAILDVDHFKQVNDRHGHGAGDEVLRSMGHWLRQSFRGEDVVARWGGEEFLIGMYGMGKLDGVRRLNTLLDQISQQAFTGPSGETFSVTFSAGLAIFPWDAEDIEGLYRVADQCLYRAKSAGRARVEAAHGGPPAQVAAAA